MNLAETVTRETGASADAVMFLRHANDSVAQLRKYGVTVEEYTCIQPVGSKYDYYHPKKPRVSVVVVIADDNVYGVYRLAGIDATGTNYTIVSDAYKNLESDRSVRVRHCHRFRIELLPSICTGLAVQGWRGRARIPVQRSGDSFFSQIQVGPTLDQDIRASVEQAFGAQVIASLSESPVFRAQRLAIAAPTPTRIAVTSYIFARNPDVVAEVLCRANGVCQACSRPAPFARKSDGSPYLEVHHRLPLADGGQDTVENAVAVCPNCHRKAHYA